MSILLYWAISMSLPAEIPFSHVNVHITTSNQDCFAEMAFNLSCHRDSQHTKQLTGVKSKSMSNRSQIKMFR